MGAYMGRLQHWRVPPGVCVCAVGGGGGGRKQHRLQPCLFPLKVQALVGHWMVNNIQPVAPPISGQAPPDTEVCCQAAKPIMHMQCPLPCGSQSWCAPPPHDWLPTTHALAYGGVRLADAVQLWRIRAGMACIWREPASGRPRAPARTQLGAVGRLPHEQVRSGQVLPGTVPHAPTHRRSSPPAAGMLHHMHCLHRTTAPALPGLWGARPGKRHTHRPKRRGCLLAQGCSSLKHLALSRRLAVKFRICVGRARPPHTTSACAQLHACACVRVRLCS